MTTDDVRAEWGRLRPAIGNLICLLEGKVGSLDALDRARKESYEKGVEDGRTECADAEYESGVKDGWNACMRIWDIDTECDESTMVAILGTCYDLRSISPMHVIEKLKEYDEEQRKIMLLAKERDVEHDLNELVRRHGYEAVVHGVESLSKFEE